jgi:hypothetical protein
MKQQLEITVPKDYSAISLKKYLKMHEDLKTYKDDDEATDATIFYHLCGLDPMTLKKIDTDTYYKIREQLISFLGKTDFPLKRTIKIGDKEYGFEPNLGEMAYGAYVDISKYDTIDIDKNWSKIMSILYRPVTKKIGALYSIEKYEGYIDEELFNDVSMDVHFGAYFFFINLSMELATDILSSLKDQAEIAPHIKLILERSGELIKQSSLLPTEMYSK